MVASTHPEWSAAFMMSSKAPFPAFDALSAAFPETTQAYYEALLERLFAVLGPHDVQPAGLTSHGLVLAANAAAALGCSSFSPGDQGRHRHPCHPGGSRRAGTAAHSRQVKSSTFDV